MKNVSTLVRFAIAWVIGSIIYFLAVIFTVYDGLGSLILQPFCAAIISFLCAVICFIIGLPLRLPMIRKVWGGSMIPAIIFAISGVALLVYSAFPGQMTVGIDPDTQEQFRNLGRTAMPGYFILLFAVTNWPHEIASVPSFQTSQ